MMCVLSLILTLDLEVRQIDHKSRKSGPFSSMPGVYAVSAMIKTQAELLRLYQPKWFRFLNIYFPHQQNKSLQS